MADPLIDELLALGRALGTHPARVAIWEEGALAVRVSRERLLVTRRGACLATLEREDLVPLDPAKMCEMATGAAVPGPEDFAAALLDDESDPPCLDALLFAYLGSLEGLRFAAHVHPIIVDQITSSPRARQFADRRTLFNEAFALGGASLLVPYAEPGLPLARETQRKMALWRDRFKTVPRMILNQNNGVILLGNTLREIIRALEMLLKYAEVFVGSSMLGGPVFLTPQQLAQAEALSRTGGREPRAEPLPATRFPFPDAGSPPLDSPDA